MTAPGAWSSLSVQERVRRVRKRLCDHRGDLIEITAMGDPERSYLCTECNVVIPYSESFPVKPVELMNPYPRLR